jgi:hypothetical protein
LEKQGFNIVFCGGDSILAYSDIFNENQIVEELNRGFWSISVGIGSSAEIAYLALQLAKARGKSQAVGVSSITTATIKTWPINRKLCIATLGNAPSRHAGLRHFVAPISIR